jgi:energy-coupling factor transport system ATP-binding protein
MKAIEIENLSFKYEEDRKLVIKNLSLSVDKGDFLCVLGENGSGKSTLSRLINGLLQPTSGVIKVFGLDTTDKKNVYEIRKRVGMVFQNPDNQMVATIVEDDIAFGPENIGVPPSEIGERIDFALDSVDMQKYRHSAGQKLSGGQKQRLAIARLLLKDSKVIVFDEATSALDNENQNKIVEVLESFKATKTIIIVAHRLSTIVGADKIYVIEDGKNIAEGTHRSLMKSCESYKELYELEEQSLEDIKIED